MIDLLLKIVDKLKELAEVRDKRAEKIFEKFIEPLYKDMEAIHKDYVETLDQLSACLAHKRDDEVYSQTRQRALEILRPRSKQLQVARDTIRASVSIREQYEGDVALFMDAISDYFFAPDRVQGRFGSRYSGLTYMLEDVHTYSESEVLYLSHGFERIVSSMIVDLKEQWANLTVIFTQIKLKTVSR